MKYKLLYNFFMLFPEFKINTGFLLTLALLIDIVLIIHGITSSSFAGVIGSFVSSAGTSLFEFLLITYTLIYSVSYKIAFYTVGLEYSDNLKNLIEYGGESNTIFSILPPGNAHIILYLFSISLAASIIWLYVNSRFRDSSIGSYSILFGILFGYIFFVLITYLAKYKIQFLFMSIIIILMLIIISRSNRTSRKININH
ncbi:hypothetical protein TZ01_00675 [Acidiplasma sp. MBA-1]|nr:hypothetical protein TZ01_00675 [Acidiplasma sp. MBA-1]